MACPVCGEHCRCSEPNAYVSGVSDDASLSDPEADDASEQRFAASLETDATSGLQSGGLDDGPVSGFSPLQERGILGASTRATTKEWDSSLLDLTCVPQPQPEACGTRATTKEWDSSLLDLTCVPQPSSAVEPVATNFNPPPREDYAGPAAHGWAGEHISPVLATATMADDSAFLPNATHEQAMEAYWRQEVASRVENFRQRRRRPRRERSLPLDFEGTWTAPRVAQPPPSVQDDYAGPAARGSACVARVSDPCATPADQPTHDRVAQPPSAVHEPAPDAPSHETNIIEFPRLPLVVPPSAEELAEPMLDRPRILDAPEAVDTCSPLADISLEPAEDDAFPGLIPELPLLAAPVSQRAFSLMIDALIVLLATGVFVMLVLKTSAEIPSTRGGLALLLGLPCVFWAIYQYLFLVHNGVTPGMQMAHLGLTTFDGEPVPRSLRRWRAIAMVLSTVSLGLGLFWALFDEDTLCWHDRITRTYLVWLPQTSGYYQT